MIENIPRKPTAQELEQLKEYYTSTGQDEKTANDIIKNNWFAVFDNCSAFVGRLLIALYGMPEFYEIFLYEETTIKRIILPCLNLEQTIQLTSIIHTSVRMYMGYARKTGYNRRRTQRSI